MMFSAARTAAAKRAWPCKGGATVRLTFVVSRHTERRRLQALLAKLCALRPAAQRCNVMGAEARSRGLLSRSHDRWLPEPQRCTRQLLRQRHVMHAASVQCDA